MKYNNTVIAVEVKICIKDKDLYRSNSVLQQKQIIYIYLEWEAKGSNQNLIDSDGSTYN